MARDLLPMSLGDAFDEAFDLYKENFALFAGIVAVVQVPAQVATQALGQLLGVQRLFTLSPGDEVTPSDLSAILGVMAFGFLVMALYSMIYVLEGGALTVAISQRYMGQRISLGEAYRRARGSMVRLALTWALAALLLGSITLVVMWGAMAVLVIASMGAAAGGTAGGTMAVFVGMAAMVLATAVAIVAGTGTAAFTTQIVVVEGVSLGAAVQRNWQLVKPRLPRVMGACVLLLVIVTALQLSLHGSLEWMMGVTVYPLLRVPDTARISLSAALGGAIGIVLQPFWLTCLTLLYYDLRVRREGLDLSLLETQLAASSPARATR
ncbi:MAG: hypothetical protein IT208_06105 [Chthonomonadales bacterium]|nr:hypothetical protein [Chthonomonadales bacterium]